MDFVLAVFEEKSRLRSLLDHFALIPDVREPWRVAHPLCEALLLVACATMADCDDYDAIAAWGDANLPFLRRYTRPRVYELMIGAFVLGVSAIEVRPCKLHELRALVRRLFGERATRVVVFLRDAEFLDERQRFVIDRLMALDHLAGEFADRLVLRAL